MNITLHFPPTIIERLEADGDFFTNPETLTWTEEHPASNYGLGVILRSDGETLIDGLAFAQITYTYDAWIEVDSEDTWRKVNNALATGATQCQDRIRVTPAS